MIGTRNLSGDLTVSAIGLGCMSLSSMYGTADEASALAALERAIELGITLFDTADVYGAGHNERFVGAALRDRRDEVVIATKFGIVADPADYGKRAVDARPERVGPACDASLERLGIDVIDLYYLHRVDLSVPIEETWGALAELVNAGKVRHLGISEPSPDSLRRAAAVHPVAAVQSEWSLWSRDIEAEIVPLCRELGAGIVAYSPLGRGFLAGAVRSIDDLGDGDFRRELPRFHADAMARNAELVDRLEALAADKGATPAQLALAWLLAQGDDVVPIPGTSKASRVEENASAADVQLTADDLASLEAVFEAGVAGERYEDMTWVNR